jgi:hypothetical protein
MSGGRVSGGASFCVFRVAGLEALRRFERKREIMFEMEKVWSDGFDGIATAILSRNCELRSKST